MVLHVRAGVNPAKIVICHTDIDIDLTYIKALLDKGAFVEFDNFGKEFYIDPADRGFAGGIFARDIDRVRTIKALIDCGYEEQLLIANDLCLKCMLRHYGGWGYDHIVRNVVPMMLDVGISKESVKGLLENNPRMVLEASS
jgi:phosphotriesterase-related protein